MALNRESFVQRMDKLNNSQQIIESTSSWCSLWRAEAGTLVSWWDEYFRDLADEEKKLSLLYLANDVLQTR